MAMKAWIAGVCLSSGNASTLAATARRPSGDSRRKTSANARSSCVAVTPRERRKPVR